MSKSSKLTPREIANVLIRNATSKEHHNHSVIVSAFGQRYKIENPYSSRPKITQLKR
jgi:hypothetical protein